MSFFRHFTMLPAHLVRVGSLGQIGRFSAIDQARYPRGSRVIVRTSRGLEVGAVLAPPMDEDRLFELDGALLRGMTIEDELLDARLSKNREAAYEACQQRLAALEVPTLLMDVEHLFDGQTLVFYFLGEQPPEVEAITAELAELYEAKAQFRSFTDTLTHGCGPDCGTEAATGGGCTSCSSGCAVAGACATKRPMIEKSE